MPGYLSKPESKSVPVSAPADAAVPTPPRKRSSSKKPSGVRGAKTPNTKAQSASKSGYTWKESPSLSTSLNTPSDPLVNSETLITSPNLYWTDSNPTSTIPMVVAVDSAMIGKSKSLTFTLSEYLASPAKPKLKTRIYLVELRKILEGETYFAGPVPEGKPPSEAIHGGLGLNALSTFPVIVGHTDEDDEGNLEYTWYDKPFTGLGTPVGVDYAFQPKGKR